MTKNSEDKLARKINLLEGEKRKNSFPAEALLQFIPIEKSNNILDLGAGTGFLSRPAAKKIDGTVYALDLDTAALNYLKEKALQENINNIKAVEGNFKDIPLDNELVDLTLASLALHEVDPLSEALQEIHRVMKDDGTLLCVEFEEKEDATGPRVHSTTMKEQLKKSGFHSIETTFPDNKIMDREIYIIVAKK